MIAKIKKMIEDKKDYREQVERIKKLPEDYRFVLEKICGYMWSLADGDGSDMLNAQKELLELFETGAAEGKEVIELTGEDVVGFCDEFLRDTKKWTDDMGKKLNLDIKNKFSEK